MGKRGEESVVRGAPAKAGFLGSPDMPVQERPLLLEADPWALLFKGEKMVPSYI
jgi:hypothetical protein